MTNNQVRGTVHVSVHAVATPTADAVRIKVWCLDSHERWTQRAVVLAAKNPTEQDIDATVELVRGVLLTEVVERMGSQLTLF